MKQLERKRTRTPRELVHMEQGVSTTAQNKDATAERPQQEQHQQDKYMDDSMQHETTALGALTDHYRPEYQPPPSQFMPQTELENFLRFLCFRCGALCLLSALGLTIIWFAVHFAVLSGDQHMLNTTLNLVLPSIVEHVLPLAGDALQHTGVTSPQDQELEQNIHD